MFSPASVCLSVFCKISQTTMQLGSPKLDTYMFRDKSWKLTYFGVKGFVLKKLLRFLIFITPMSYYPVILTYY